MLTGVCLKAWSRKRGQPLLPVCQCDPQCCQHQVGTETSPAGPCPSSCPGMGKDSGWKPRLSRGMPKAVSFASKVCSMSLCACEERVPVSPSVSRGELPASPPSHFQPHGITESFGLEMPLRSLCPPAVPRPAPTQVPKCHIHTALKTLQDSSPPLPCTLGPAGTAGPGWLHSWIGAHPARGDWDEVVLSSPGDTLSVRAGVAWQSTQRSCSSSRAASSTAWQVATTLPPLSGTARDSQPRAGTGSCHMNTTAIPVCPAVRGVLAAPAPAAPPCCHGTTGITGSQAPRGS